MLSTQYRMHGADCSSRDRPRTPETTRSRPLPGAIRQFPSLHFYGGLLRDAPSITHMMRQCPGTEGAAPSPLPVRRPRTLAGPFPTGSEGGAPSYLSGAAGCQPERRAGGGGAVGRLAPHLCSRVNRHSRWTRSCLGVSPAGALPLLQPARREARRVRQLAVALERGRGGGLRRPPPRALDAAGAAAARLGRAVQARPTAHAVP